MMMKILFVPQNDTHFLNMKQIAYVLKEKNVQVHYLDTRKWFYQKLDFSDSDILIEIPDKYTLKRSFFLYSNLQRLKIVLKSRQFLVNLTNNYDAFILGSESALHRVIIHAANRKMKKTFLIHDGALSEPNYSILDVIKNSSERSVDLKIYFKQLINKKFISFFRYGKLSYMLPGLDGASGVSYIFTMGNFNKIILDKRKKKNTKIIASGIPRYIRDTEINYSFDKDNFHICFIGAGYKWHGNYLFEKYQHNDIKQLCEVVNDINKNNIRLHIKMHPRGDINDYLIYKKYKFVDIIVDKDMSYCFKTQNLLLTQVSTTLIEAFQFNRFVYSLSINYPYWKRKGNFTEKSFIKKIYSKDELKSIIEDSYHRQMNSKNFDFVEESEISEFISKSTNISDKIIVETILSNI